MTWLASNWCVNITPNSEEKDFIGERVPEVRMMHRELDNSEKAYRQHESGTTGKGGCSPETHRSTHNSRVHTPEAQSMSQHFLCFSPCSPGYPTCMLETGNTQAHRKYAMSSMSGGTDTGNRKHAC